MTVMHSYLSYARRTLHSTLATICYQIRFASLWVLVTLQQPRSPRKLSALPPELPTEDLSPQIRAARIQRIVAESKLRSTEKYLGAEVAAVRRLCDELLRGALGQKT